MASCLEEEFRMRTSIVVGLLSCVTATALLASSLPSLPPRSPHDEATRAYNDGLKYRDRAWAAEKELAVATDPARRTQLEEIIRKSYAADVRSQRSAISSDSSLVQAHTELGYALRKSGNYEEALSEYDTSLRMVPNYAEAIEYRAEAYLALNRVDDARNAYLQLYNGRDHTRAQLLADAMQKWLATRRNDPAAVAPEKIDELAKWLSQRSEISKQTGTASSGSWN
jgi:tetratricopeptide (TPR) repeat protein